MPQRISVFCHTFGLALVNPEFALPLLNVRARLCCLLGTACFRGPRYDCMV